MFFMDIQSNFKLTISESVSCFFSSIQQTGGFGVEMGGILVGQFCSSNEILLTDVTTPQKLDKKTSNRFVRFELGHQEVMDALWEESQYKKFYLGEWHTHNQNSPLPSSIDIKNWKTISKRDHESERLFFIIVGKNEVKAWFVLNQAVTQMKHSIPYDLRGGKSNENK